MGTDDLLGLGTTLWVLQWCQSGVAKNGTILSAYICKNIARHVIHEGLLDALQPGIYHSPRLDFRLHGALLGAQLTDDMDLRSYARNGVEAFVQHFMKEKSGYEKADSELTAINNVNMFE